VGALARRNDGLIENVDVIHATVSSVDNNSNAGLGGVVGYSNGIVRNVSAVVDVRAGASVWNVGGLIGRMQSGQVSNCVTSGSVVRDAATAGAYAGGLVAKMEGGTIDNSHSSVNVVSDRSEAGGLVGNAGGISVTASSSSGSVYSSNHSVGGLLGRTGALVDSCFSTSAVYGLYYVGGLIGYTGAAAIITNANASGTVIATGNDAGGLVGQTNGRISESHATGDVEGIHRVGGLVGTLEVAGRIENASAMGSVTGVEYDVGGLIGLVSGKVANTQASGTVRADSQVGGLVGRVDSTGRLFDSRALNVDVKGGHRVGGLVGQATGLIQRCTASAESPGEVGVVGTTSVGGLVGIGYGAIVDSHASPSVLGGGNNVGGLVGYCTDGCTVVGSSAEGEVSSDGMYVGGLVGRANETPPATLVVVDSHASGSVVGRDWYVGGLVGWGQVNVVRSSASGSVVGTDYVGGLVGQLYERPSSIENSLATGSVQGTAGALLVGNLVGQLRGGTVAHSYATGSVIAKASGGALVGGTSSNGRHVGNATDASANPGLADTNPEIVAHTPAQLRQWATFANKNWNPHLWQIDEGDAPPRFAEPLEPDYCDEVSVDTATFVGHGSGTTADPYQICTSAQLQTIADDSSLWASHFRLMRNLDASAITGSFGAAGNEFSGTFDGNHHSLVRFGPAGLALPTTELFGELSGTLRDLIWVRPTVAGASVGGLLHRVLPGGQLVNVHVVSGLVTATTTSTGGLVALNDGRIQFSTSSALMTNDASAAAQILAGLVGENSVSGSVEDSFCTGQVDRIGTAAGDWAGGLVGWNYGLLDRVWSSAKVTSTKNGVGGLVARNSGTVNYGWAMGSVTGVDRVGGLIGDQPSSGTVWRGRATGNVAATTNAGGLLGRNAGDVGQSYASGTVGTTTNYAGGLVGWLDGGSIVDSRAGGTGAGTIGSASGLRGGIAGQASGSAQIVNTIGADLTGTTNLGGVVGSATNPSFTLEGNFWNSSKTAASNIVNGVPSITIGGQGRSTTLLKQQNTFTNNTSPAFAKWDFNNVWIMTETVTEPRLRWTDNPTGCASCPLAINGVTPNTGYYPGALEIAVLGSGFDSTTSVTVGGAPCTNLSLVSDGLLTCLTPPGNVGPVDVVAYEGATQAIAPVGSFTYKNFTRADTLAGTGVAGNVDGAGDVARFSSSINGFALRGSTLYVADGMNSSVRTIDLSELDPNNPQPTSVTVSTLAGGTYGTADSTNGTGTTAQFSQPDDFTFGPGNFLYLSDGGPLMSNIRQVNITSGETTTAVPGFEGADGIAIVGQYGYVTDCVSNTIFRWEVGTQEWTEFVGKSGYSGDLDDVGTAARMDCPYGLEVDSTGSYLYFTDWYNYKVKRVELATATVTTVAGTVYGHANGDAITAARFRYPNKIAVAPQHLFVTDMLNCAVRQINLATSQVSTIAGTQANCTRVDGPLATARFGTVIAIAYSPVFGLFVGAGDWGNTAGGYFDPTSVVTLIH